MKLGAVALLSALALHGDSGHRGFANLLRAPSDDRRYKRRRPPGRYRGQGRHRRRARERSRSRAGRRRPGVWRPGSRPAPWGPRGRPLDGGHGDDLMQAGPGDDRMFDDAAVFDDRFLGGRGSDRVSWQGRRPVVADLTGGLAHGHGRDVLRGVESLVGTPGGDTLIGDDGAEHPQGNGRGRPHRRSGRPRFARRRGRNRPPRRRQRKRHM